jgi:hypothetical protein
MMKNKVTQHMMIGNDVIGSAVKKQLKKLMILKQDGSETAMQRYDETRAWLQEMQHELDRRIEMESSTDELSLIAKEVIMESLEEESRHYYGIEIYTILHKIVSDSLAADMLVIDMDAVTAMPVADINEIKRTFQL